MEETITNGFQEDTVTRIDSTLVNAITEMGTASDKSEYTRAGHGFVLTKAELERLYKIRIIQRVCDAIPESAILKGWEVTLGKKADPKILADIGNYQERLSLADKFKRAQIQANLYGGAVIILVIDDGRPASEPVNEKSIKSVKALYVRDRYKVRPVTGEAAEIDDPDHYEYMLSSDRELSKLKVLFPEKAKPGTLYGYRIHKDRILRFDGVEYPPDMMERNEGWGGSLIEAIWEDYRDYKTSIKSVATMVNDFSLFIYSIRNLDKIIKANDEELLKQRIKFMQLMTSVFGGVAIDAEGEKIEYASRNFSGIDSIIDKLRDAFIGSSQIPHDKLFGESPSGLGATGESEEKNWSHTVESFQVSRWARPLRRSIRYMFLAQDSPTKAKEPPDWGIKFHSLQQESAQDKAAVRSTQSQTDNTYVTAGILLPEEIRNSRFGGSEYSVETQLDNKLWEENKAQMEQQNQFGDFGGEVPPEETPTEEAPAEEPPPEDDFFTADSLRLDTELSKKKDADIEDIEEPDTATLIAEAAKAPLAKSVDDWISILDEWVKQFDSLEEADAQLAEAYDQLKDKNFTKTLEQYNMLAHLAGMAEIIDEDTEDDK